MEPFWRCISYQTWGYSIAIKHGDIHITIFFEGVAPFPKGHHGCYKAGLTLYPFLGVENQPQTINQPSSATKHCPKSFSNHSCSARNLADDENYILSCLDLLGRIFWMATFHMNPPPTGGCHMRKQGSQRFLDVGFWGDCFFSDWFPPGKSRKVPFFEATAFAGFGGFKLMEINSNGCFPGMVYCIAWYIHHHQKIPAY